jgi:DNA modification methylase
MKNARKFVGIELSSVYCDMAMKRIKPYLEQKHIDLAYDRLKPLLSQKSPSGKQLN